MNNNKRILHRKEWQMMTPSPVATAAGSFMIKDPLGIKRTTLFVSSNTVQYLYAVDDDAWMLTPNMAIAGTFGNGACGAWGQWSNTLTANGGTASSLTTATAINNAGGGNVIRFLTGSQAGKEVTCTGTKVVPGGTSTMNFTPTLSGAIANGDTFVVQTGKYYVMGAGTIASGIFKSIDPLTGVITTLSNTGLPATWGTDGRLVGTPSYVGAFATGTATSATSTTIVNSAKTWTVNQWTNYQVRITAGTGIGQVRTISSNTATTLTVPAWTVTPDTSSVYALESNDDFLYLLGNNAITMYRYSISANTWTTMSPTVARVSAVSSGGGANWIAKTGDAFWSNESDIQDGRYIYSFRGNSSAMDRFDIAGGTAGAGAWSAITYIGQAEVFGNGSCYADNGDKIFIRQGSANRFFTYSVVGNNLYPFTTNLYPDGLLVFGDKLFTARYTDSDNTIDWLYSLRHTGTELHRIMIF